MPVAKAGSSVPVLTARLARLASVETGAAYVNAPARVVVPPGVVTATSTAPAACAGVIAVIWVALSRGKLVAAVPPNVTAVAPVGSAPVRTTLVPPVAGPVAGETGERAGGAATGVQLTENVSELGGSWGRPERGCRFST